MNLTGQTHYLFWFWNFLHLALQADSWVFFMYSIVIREISFFWEEKETPIHLLSLSRIFLRAFPVFFFGEEWYLEYKFQMLGVFTATWLSLQTQSITYGIFVVLPITVHK